ncbi:hypothetical protein [Mycobacterium alsense]|uniref:hypothetical protein n=1 Tax=Mycobacterium alsense TaxID=324058 RepID=UPI0021F32E0C|nr:hypothetical protein [Mycobacterium alsense]
MNLAAAISALVAPTVWQGLANATNPDETQPAAAGEAPLAEATSETTDETTLPSRVDLMGFTVYQKADGVMVPKHGSHYSHASHASHASSSY